MHRSVSLHLSVSRKFPVIQSGIGFVVHCHLVSDISQIHIPITRWIVVSSFNLVNYRSTALYPIA